MKSRKVRRRGGNLGSGKNMLPSDREPIFGHKRVKFHVAGQLFIESSYISNIAPISPVYKV